VKQIVFGFLGAVVFAGAVFVGYVAYQDHKVVKTLSILAAEIGEANGQKVTATDVVAALVNERIQQIQAAKAQKAASEVPQK
jgi:alpha-D-ribose 1-methylphosphonate 5-triphosphate synthase subunit PhnG